MRQFKLPLIVTGITLLVALIIGLVIGTIIYKAKISDRRKLERAEMLGKGLATASGIIIAPFWWVVAARIGKRRRAEREAKKRGES